MKFIRLLISAFAFLLPSLASAAAPEVVPSIVALRSGNFGNYPVLLLTAFSSGGSVGGGILVQHPSDVTSRDDNCRIYVDAAGHRFYRQISGNGLDVTMCGAVPDNSTDATSTFQAAENVAAENKYEILCRGSFVVGSSAQSITMGAGVKHQGSGQSQCSIRVPLKIGTTIISPKLSAATNPGTAVLHFASTAGIVDGMRVTNLSAKSIPAVAEVLGHTPTTVTMTVAAVGPGVRTSDTIVFGAWMFRLRQPNGSGAVEAPKFFDMSLTCASCIQYNNPLGGFTDDGSTQRPFQNVRIERVTFSPVDANTGIAVQVSKANHGTFRDVLVSLPFDTDIDLEGSDSFEADNVALWGAYTQHILLEAHGTFGNEFTLNHATLTALSNNGSCVASISDNYRSSTIQNSYFENGNIGACPEINLGGGFHAIVRGNAISQVVGSIANWMKVADGPNGYLSLDISDNYNGGGLVAPILFNGGRAVTAIKNGGTVRAVIKHSGNFNEIGYPPGSVP